MSGRLTHGEIRIIEETKRQGEELYGVGKAANGGIGKDDTGKAVRKNRSMTSRKASIISVAIFAVIFIALALVVRLFVAWLAY